MREPQLKVVPAIWDRTVDDLLDFVHGFDGSVSLIVVLEADKAKTTAASSVAILDDYLE